MTGVEPQFEMDTSGFINGWRDHYPPAVFPAVWQFIGDQLDAGVVSNREVYKELIAQKDDLSEFAKKHKGAFKDPSAAVQKAVGPIQAEVGAVGTRDAADPWVIAEAKVGKLTVITYEGRSFSGVPHKKWWRSMPGICKQFNVPCCTLPEALERLGAQF